MGAKPPSTTSSTWDRLHTLMPQHLLPGNAQPTSYKAMLNQKLTCILIETLPSILHSEKIISFLAFIKGNVTEKKLSSHWQVYVQYLLCSSLPEYQTFSAMTWQDYSQFPPTLDCPLFPPTPTSHPLWLKEIKTWHTSTVSEEASVLFSSAEDNLPLMSLK